MRCDLIVEGKYVLPMDDKLTVIENGAVVVEKNNIIAVGGANELLKKYKAREVINAGHSIVMPGLVNTHTHAAMVYFRGLADDLSLQSWLEKHIWPAEAKFVNPDFVRQASKLACLEMIKSGIVCFNDMYFFAGVTAEAAKEAGLRCVLGEGIIDFSTPSCRTPGEAVDKTRRLLDEYQDDELVNIAFAPHSIYGCSRETLLKVKEAAGESGAAIHIHVSETRKEVLDSRKKRGLTPVAYLNGLGLLNGAVTAAHSVWLNESDMEIYESKKVKVSHCPVSNMKLASGIAPVEKMLEQGIVVGLGTDGAASNNTLDVFREMRVCALLHKVNNTDPTAMPAREIVKMASINGARVLDLDGRTGSIEAGKGADIITVNLDKPHLAPLYDPYSHLVYCARGSDVDDVIIGGRVVMRNREVKTVDEEKILKNINSQCPVVNNN